MFDRVTPRLALAVFLAMFIAVPEIHTQDASKMQLPADQRAFSEASAISDQGQRLDAMVKAIESYPKSSRVFITQKYIFDTLIQYFPDRTSEIETQTRLILKDEQAPLPKPFLEIYMASGLAEARGTGINLPLAEEMAKDALSSYSSEDVFINEALGDAKKYHEPPPSMALLHSDFISSRAGALATLSQIYLDQKRITLATAKANEAYSLAPAMSEANLVKGELALKERKKREALDYFERADVGGEVKSPWRETMMELYRGFHEGSEQNFVADMDAQYNRLFPLPFAPEPHGPLTPRRTMLLELFTGSACKPCAGADLALDGLLDTFSRNELVVLAFDEHIPDPDPLTNPDSVARAAYYGIHNTPSFVLDGRRFAEDGGTRDHAEMVYKNCVRRVEAESAGISSVQLNLTANRDTEGIIHADVAVSQKPDTASGPSRSHLVTRVALVEDHVRYAGESGIRFHRMVVRALAHPSSKSDGQTDRSEVVFDPASISKELKAYLDQFEVRNETFGSVKFLSKDTNLDPSHLAVAAWVEDTDTHRVLQAAFTSLSRDASREGASLHAQTSHGAEQAR